MDIQSEADFRWLSPLGVSVALFLIYGAVYIVIGALTPVMHNTDIGRTMLIISNRTDSALFGGSPSELLQTDPALARLRTILLNIVGGLLAAAGCFQLAITWFSLRQGQMWALIALAVGGLVVLPFWLLVFRPYFEAGVSLALSDIPPFMWVPGVVLLPAIVLGWIGLQS